MSNNWTLNNIVEIFKDLGCNDQILIKYLSENDNSKNQIYFGSNFEALTMFPNLKLIPSLTNDTIKAALKFSWISEDGRVCRAPGAQLIFYPQYPEVRFSGFLQGCDNSPSSILSVRQSGRILLLGISSSGDVFGYVTDSTSNNFAEIRKRIEPDPNNVFQVFEFNKISNEQTLLDRLKEINQKGWIDGWRLDALGNAKVCNSPNCGGYTLEAELGVLPNSNAEPDFLGWEIKQYNVRNLNRPDSGNAITLMTPEPDCGCYQTQGFNYFILKYGYKDRNISGRKNFGGVHRYGKKHSKTELKLDLVGYDPNKKKITDINGFLGLFDPSENLAAGWTFIKLMEHWNKKHNKAAYIPSQTNFINNKNRQYHYGHLVRLCKRTDFILFLNNIINRDIYFDPGMKITGLGDENQKTKRRSQFRISARHIPDLYMSSEIIELL